MHRYLTIAPTFGVAIPKSTSRNTDENNKKKSIFLSRTKNAPTIDSKKQMVRNNPSNETTTFIKPSNLNGNPNDLNTPLNNVVTAVISELIVEMA